MGKFAYKWNLSVREAELDQESRAIKGKDVCLSQKLFFGAPDVLVRNFAIEQLPDGESCHFRSISHNGKKNASRKSGAFNCAYPKRHLQMPGKLALLIRSQDQVVRVVSALFWRSFEPTDKT